MTTVMIDAIHDNVPHIPPSAPKVAGYTTGTPDIEWAAADWARFPHAGKVRIDQGYTWPPDPHSYDVLDVEHLAVTPAEVPAAVKARIAAGITWTTVYASDGALAAVVADLIAAGPHGWFYGHVDCWLADWNLSMAQAGALLGKEIHGLTCRAVQWASPSAKPGTLVPGTALTLAQANVDLSITDDTWHAPPPLPPPPPAEQAGILVYSGQLALAARTVVSRDGGRTWA